MSTSLPSREIYAVDVPEVKNFTSTFKYNFFVPDESVEESSGVPAKLMQRSASEVDSGFIQQITSRVARFVLFTWSKPTIADVGNAVSDTKLRNNVFDTGVNGSIIADNIKKVLTEDVFSSYDFASVSFHDGELENKAYRFVSGSLELQMLDVSYDHNVSANKSAAQLNSTLPQYIKSGFVFSAFGDSTRSSGTHFKRNRVNDVLARAKNVTLNVQINSKMFTDIVNRNVRDSHSQFSGDMNSLHNYSKQLDAATKQKFSLNINENEFKTVVPFVDLKVQRTAQHAQHQPAQIVGYVIDKGEFTDDGSVISHPPIIIDNPRSDMTVDTRVRYGKTYVYSIRAVALFTLPAIDNVTGDIATISILISSKPSDRMYVTTVENVAPPPPADVSFTWNYETDKLVIHWAFPPNSQRDIKQFQVFRRDSTDVAFELLKVYDFDDSIVPLPKGEFPQPNVVERVTSPVTFYVDDDFDRNMGSRYIYTVCCVDAHGLTSNYGAQFEITFDLFKNRLQKKLISHTGAPKPYPNMYLEADAFVDTIRVSGPNSKRMRLYFNPQYYQTEDDAGNQKRIISTKQQGGSYKLQFMNLDNQKSQMLTVTIDDRIKEITSEVVYPKEGS